MIKIDFHSHIIPRIDHGSSSVETSLLQLKLAREAGVEIILATSHFYPHMHNAKGFVARRDRIIGELRSAMGDEIPRIIPAAEVLVCDGINRMPDLELLCIEGTRSILMELPLGMHMNDAHIETFRELFSDGFDIIIAHADRYLPSDIETLVELGAKIQLNASALSHFTVKKHLKDWIARGIVVALGSDIHGADKSAYKKYRKAIKRLKEQAPAIMERSRKIIFKENEEK